MECYVLKTHGTTQNLVTITQETSDGYMIRIIKDLDGYEEVKNEYITKELFETCLRTGYLTKTSVPAQLLAAIA